MLLNSVLSVLLLVFIALSSLGLFVIAAFIWLVTKPFDKRLRLLHLFACFWASIYVWITPYWRVKYIDTHLIDPRRTYVIISNHQSLLDILVAFGLFVHFKWVSKIEIFKVPVIGWNMRLNDYVALKRGDAESVAQMMAHCEHHLAQGSSVYLFPEGTRSFDGRVKPFKKGAFQLAKKLGVPILPLVIDGTTRALPKKSMVLTGRHEISLRALPAIEPEMFEDCSPEELAERVRSQIVAALGQSG
ncbi:MAG: lysophospholipid acyltransferase family protein [Oleiphilaceae bacterium]|nr:lysophospholipid acyltransferase family protein [Oleiphilaceae bacterium]